MCKLIFYPIIGASAFFAAGALAEGPDYTTLSEQVDDVFDCLLVKPMLAQTTESSTRIGAILSGVRIDRVSGHVISHRIVSPNEYCTPTVALPEGAAANEPSAWRYAKGASVSLTAEVEKIFTLGSIKANNIRASEFNIREPKIYQLPSDKRRQSGRDIKSRGEDCSPALKNSPAQNDYINYPIIITATCVGKLDLGFVFDRGVDITALNAQIGSFKVGLSLQLRETLGSEVPCGKDTPAGTTAPTAKPAETGADATSTKESAAAAAKGLADLALKAWTEAIQKIKLLTDAAAKATDEAEKKKNTDAATAEKAKADELKKKADTAKGEAEKAAKSPVAIAGKCYDSARLVSDQPVVFGFQYKRADTYIPK
jgi:hypothetical protein